MADGAESDIIIVGGGLSGCLAAWLIKQRRPDLRLRLLERDATLGGNHTWSFFETDMSAAQARAIAPLVTSSWPGYRVRFPGYGRELTTGYRSIASQHLHQLIAGALGGDVTFGAEVTAVAADHVTLASGAVLRAPCVIDARGAQPSPFLALGFQKFLGLELRLAAPHQERLPVIMDATVPQDNGYRFVYTLPLADDRILIEDTYYSDDANLSIEALRQRIADYARQQGWVIAETLRTEHGVLPIILAGNMERYLALQSEGAPRIGLAAAFFHPTTGYSLPDATQVAMLLAEHAERGAPTSASVAALLIAHAKTIWRERAYFRLLNRMMFRAGRPHERYTILQRFYRLDAGLLQRFYAARLTLADRLRIVMGKPPVPILPALACLSEAKMLAKSNNAPGNP
jgi:lycopene beta-cyclase